MNEPKKSNPFWRGLFHPLQEHKSNLVPASHLNPREALVKLSSRSRQVKFNSDFDAETQSDSH